MYDCAMLQISDHFKRHSCFNDGYIAHRYGYPASSQASQAYTISQTLCSEDAFHK